MTLDDLKEFCMRADLGPQSPRLQVSMPLRKAQQLIAVAEAAQSLRNYWNFNREDVYRSLGRDAKESVPSIDPNFRFGATLGLNEALDELEADT